MSYFSFVKYTFLIIFVLGCNTTKAQQLNVGVVIQKTHSLYWENGISTQYSFSSFRPQQFYIGFDLLSSRIGSAFNSNALKQESYIFSAAWYFRKDKPLRIVTELNVGFFHADLEEEIFDELPNTAFLLSPEVGLSYAFQQTPININFGTGYNVGLKGGGESPGTLQPFYYNLTLYYRLNKKSKDEAITE